MDINNKVIIVTGGAKGLGKKIAEDLLQSGAKIVVLDIDLKSLNNMKENKNILKIQCDLTNEVDIQNAVHKILEIFSRVDVLINNAGILYSEPLINLTSKEKKHNLANWYKVIDINLTAPFIVGSYVAEKMLMNRTQGLIINISSISAKGNIGQTAYSAAKAGLEAMTKVWAKELGAFGIRSVAIAPGFMDISSTHKALNENILSSIKKQVPLKKLGKAEDISQAVKFVIENDYFNGKVLEIDGGLSI